jgi:hypothetical protein
MAKKTSTDPVDEAFSRVMEDLRRDLATGPQLLNVRNIILVMLFTAAISCASIAWVYADTWTSWFSPF